MHAFLILDKSDWVMVNYSEYNGFPIQTDANSCGVYVCAVAKSIISNTSLPAEPNLTKFSFQMATEIANL